MKKTSQPKTPDGVLEVMVYSSGMLPDNTPYYAYLAIPPSKYLPYIEAVENKKPIILGDYGRILFSGFEQEPPQEVKDRMKNEFGFNHEFEKELMVEIDRQKTKEDKLSSILKKIRENKNS